MADAADARRPIAPLHGERSVVRPATVVDADLLVSWHADPEVARFWDGETFTREQMVERLARPDVDAYVVEVDAEPVGYIQAWFEEGTDVAGLDMFLIPPRAAAAWARTLHAHSPPTFSTRAAERA